MTGREWVFSLRPGDVVRWRKSGTLRVVREFTDHRTPRKPAAGFVTFLIRHCSWTGRGYTVYTASDVASLCEPTGANVGIDQAILALIRLTKKETRRIGGKYTLSCCDVRGLA